MNRTFSTPDPTSLLVELGAGHLLVTTDATMETVVDVEGEGAGDVVVDQRGDEIVVLSRPGLRRLLGDRQDVSVRVRLPHDSRLRTRLGSAGTRVEGRVGAAVLRSGSGDITVEELGADTSVETGSGDLTVDVATGPLTVTTGSGKVLLGVAHDAVRARSGSGDVRVREAHADVSLSSGSGSLSVDLMHRGSLTARNASGDILVGVPAGVPVWTDVSSASGHVRSDLARVGEPAEGQDFLDLRARTASGDVHLALV